MTRRGLEQRRHNRRKEQGMRLRWIVWVAVVGALAFAAAGCGGGDDDGAEGSEEVSGSISIMAIWAGEEQASFEAVIAGFEELYPNVSVNYTSGGDNLAPLLSTAVEGGNPPDIAAIGQPGLMADFASQGAIQPIDDLRDAIVENFGESVADVGAVDGTQYGIMFKGSNKSTIWFNVDSFEEAGVDPPETWDDLTEVRDTLTAAGITPYSVGVDVGWPITDLFENIYIRTAGPEMYDQLANHEIPWTDQSVKDALAVMADIVGQSDYMAGGTDGALQTEMPDSVAKVFTDSPEAAMVVIGDFAPGVVETTLEPETGFNVFTFPSIDDSDPAVVGGGDLFVEFRKSEAADAFMEYLTTADAAEIWAERGGFSSPNKNVDTDIYPDEITRTTAGALGEAETFRFDLSDLQPSAFGGTPGQGLFKLFSDFVANPDDIDGITQQMEAAASQAFG
jgi:alpha-glucoside transport system substrate-binding protein